MSSRETKTKLRRAGKVLISIGAAIQGILILLVIAILVDAIPTFLIDTLLGDTLESMSPAMTILVGSVIGFLSATAIHRGLNLREIEDQAIQAIQRIGR